MAVPLVTRLPACVGAGDGAGAGAGAGAGCGAGPRPPLRPPLGPLGCPVPLGGLSVGDTGDPLAGRLGEGRLGGGS